ncbi:MAG: DUF4846 domain-containing protein [Bacteroidetes bacterium]|nr:DUF4846 domain-containing protein [Bacteroidota bacterium]
MSLRFTIFLLAICTILSCQQVTEGVDPVQELMEQFNIDQDLISPDGMTIDTRIDVPLDFRRVFYQPGTFGAYLQQLPLKPHGTEVKLYDGSIKENRDIYDAVVDMDIGDRDLQQCADAVMRLRGEYLFSQKKYDEIHFNFTNGFRVDYSEWMKGKHVIVDGNKSYWSSATTPSNTYEDFRKYMDIIFAYAGTLSLSAELEKVELKNLTIGDIFIQGGSPGHAVIVVDVAKNAETKEKIFLLAQSFMPAQETQILQNPNKEEISPWYSANFEGDLETPQWTFKDSDLKRFPKD